MNYNSHHSVEKKNSEIGIMNEGLWEYHESMTAK